MLLQIPLSDLLVRFPFFISFFKHISTMKYMNVQLLDACPIIGSDSESHISQEQEREIQRVKSMYDFLTQIAKRLKLAQPVVSTAQYLCHVYKYNHNYFYDPMTLCAAALYLAAKIHNKHRSIADFVEVFYGFKYGGYSTPNQTVTKERSQKISENIQRAEKELANCLGYDFDIDLPYSYLNEFHRIVGDSQELDRIVTTASFFMNDIFMTEIVLFFHPLVIAMACLKIAREYIQVKEKAELPEFPEVRVETDEGQEYTLEWFQILDERVNIEGICEVQRRVERFYQKCQKTFHKKKAEPTTGPAKRPEARSKWSELVHSTPTTTASPSITSTPKQPLSISPLFGCI